MTTVAHISDLHFGREEPRVAEGLLADLSGLRPRLVVLSGDLTQRARRRQFAAARDFLARIEAPPLIVPGNHDIPLFDVARRFLRPLHRFRDYISRDVDPLFCVNDRAVLMPSTISSSSRCSGRRSREMNCR